MKNYIQQKKKITVFLEILTSTVFSFDDNKNTKFYFAISGVNSILKYIKTENYGSPFLPLKKKEKMVIVKKIPHNSDLFSRNCEFTSHNSDRIAWYKRAVIKSVLRNINSQLQEKTFFFSFIFLLK